MIARGQSRWLLGCILAGLCAALPSAQAQDAKPTVPPGQRAKEERKPAESRPPQPSNDAEAKVLAMIDEMKDHSRGTNNVPIADGRLLRILTESTGAKTVLELGTSNGYSGLWICMGLRKTGGHLTTMEIDDVRFEIAKEHFEKAGVSDLITQVLCDAHEEVTKFEGPIDLLFIDADKDGYLDYLTKLLPKVRPGGLILAHNMKAPLPNPEFVKAITTNPALETQFYNMDEQGMAVILKKR